MSPWKRIEDNVNRGENAWVKVLGKTVSANLCLSEKMSFRFRPLNDCQLYEQRTVVSWSTFGSVVGDYHCLSFFS